MIVSQLSKGKNGQELGIKVINMLILMFYTPFLTQFQMLEVWLLRKM